jgi:hypothetical protein
MQQPLDGILMGDMLHPPVLSIGNRQGKIPFSLSSILSFHVCPVYYIIFIFTVSDYHGDMLSRTANLDYHSLSHHDVAGLFEDASTGLGDVSRTLFDPVPFNETFTDYPNGFTESTLHSSFASLEASNLGDSSRLQTFTSEALYTNHLSQKEAEALYTNHLNQKEADALSFAGISSSEVLHYCLNFLDSAEVDGHLLLYWRTHWI